MSSDTTVIAMATPTGTLTGTVLNTINYLNEMLHGVEDGPAKTGMIDDNCRNLIKMIGGLTFDLPDATSAMKLARESTPMLSSENVEHIRLAITRSSGTVLKHAGQRGKQVCDPQEHNHIEEYFTEPLWTLLRSDIQLCTKLTTVAEFIVDTLGLHYPKELTCASIVGVILAAHGKSMAYQKANENLWSFKGMVSDCRARRLSTRTLAKFPSSVAEFMTAHPSRYSTEAPPVECPLSSAVLMSGRHLVAARATNKKLKTDNHGILRPEVAAPHVPSYNQAFRDGVASTKSATMSVDAHLAKSITGANVDVPVADTTDNDHQQAEATEEENEDIDEKLANMRKALEGAHGSTYTKAAIGKMMKRPGAASILKRPTASVLKKPSHGSDIPRQPKLKNRFDPIKYMGCKIYWGGERKYRVLTAPKKGTKNFSWQAARDAPDVWCDVVACCEEHAH